MALILRAKAQDPQLYRMLWSAAVYDEQASRARMLQLLAIFLYDDREAFSGLRFSEMAAHRLTVFSGDRFGLDPHLSLAEIPAAGRGEAVPRARAWLQNQPAQ